jgi:hypothetical protein
MAINESIKTLALMIETYRDGWKNSREASELYNAQFNAAIMAVELLGYSIQWKDEKIVAIYPTAYEEVEK